MVNNGYYVKNHTSWCSPVMLVALRHHILAARVQDRFPNHLAGLLKALEPKSATQKKGCFTKLHGRVLFFQYEPYMFNRYPMLFCKKACKLYHLAMLPKLVLNIVVRFSIYQFVFINFRVQRVYIYIYYMYVYLYIYMYT